MNKDEAIQECLDNVELYGNIFGDFHVIRKKSGYESVSNNYIKNYGYKGKIYHTVEATEPKDVDVQEQAMKELLLSMCKTRGERRRIEREYTKGKIRKLFKRFM